MTISSPKTLLTALLTLATVVLLSLVTACSKTEAPTVNHAITFVHMIDDKAVCDSIRSGMGAFPDVAQCRTGNFVFHCEAGPNTPANCKKIADLGPPPQQQPPQAERPPAPPSGSPVLPSPAPQARP